MNPIRLNVTQTGKGRCALTGRTCEGLTVAFEGEPPAFLGWTVLRQLVSMRAGRMPKPSMPGVSGGEVTR